MQELERGHQVVICECTYVGTPILVEIMCAGFLRHRQVTRNSFERKQREPSRMEKFETRLPFGSLRQLNLRHLNLRLS
jgi:hypothetical protein